MFAHIIYSTTTLNKISLSIQNQFLTVLNLISEFLELKTNTNWGIGEFVNSRQAAAMNFHLGQVFIAFCKSTELLCVNVVDLCRGVILRIEV